MLKQFLIMYINLNEYKNETDQVSRFKKANFLF